MCLIKARSLFFTPSFGAILLLIPFFGIPLYIMLLAGWYMRNQKDIHAYFRGYTYRQNELSDQNTQTGI